MMTNQPPIDAGRVRAYLLGDLAPEDMDAVERAYFASEAALDEVAAVEEEIIEEYLASPPGSSRWAGFESRYLASPAHRRRVALIRDLQRRAPHRARVVPLFPLAIAAAILIAAAVGVVEVRRAGLSGERAAVSRPGAAATAVAGATAVAITLPAVMVRGEGETPTVHAGGTAGEVTLRLEKGETAEAPPYRVTVRTVEGSEIWTGGATPATGAEARDGAGVPLVASVTIPASSLPDGDYVVVLAGGGGGSSEIHRYFFRLVRD